MPLPHAFRCVRRSGASETKGYGGTARSKKCHAQRRLTQINTGQAPWIHLGVRYLTKVFETMACDGTLINWLAPQAGQRIRMPSTMQVAKSNGFNSIPSATGGIARLACARLNELGKDPAVILSKVGLTLGRGPRPSHPAGSTNPDQAPGIGCRRGA